MRIRWISNRPNPELPIVGQAIVASWWPGRYYLVSTIQIDGTSPLERLTHSIRAGEPFNEVAAAPEVFVTNVYRCTRDGWIGDNGPLYEEVHTTLPQAREGHTRVLEQFAKNALKLSSGRK